MTTRRVIRFSAALVMALVSCGRDDAASPVDSTGAAGQAARGGGGGAANYQCVDARVVRSAAPGAFVRCDPASSGVECVVSGPCPTGGPGGSGGSGVAGAAGGPAGGAAGACPPGVPSGDWARLIGAGPTAELKSEVDAVVALPCGDVVAAGRFHGAVDLGAGLVATPISDGNNQHAFIARYASDGALVWGTTVGDTTLQSFDRLAADDAGSLFVSGSNRGLWTMGGQTLHAHYHDAVVAKLGTDGSVAWARDFGHPQSDFTSVAALVPAPGGDLFVVGAFRGNVDFGTGILNADDDAFVARLDSGGFTQWVTLFAGPMVVGLEAAAPAPDGGVVVSGTCTQSVTVLGETLPCATAPGGLGGGLLARLGPDGSLTWLKTVPTKPGFGVSLPAVASDASGAVFVVAQGGGLDFGGGAFAGERGIAKLDGAGAHVWSRGFDAIGLAIDTATSLTLQSDGALLIAGARHVIDAKVYLEAGVLAMLTPDGKVSKQKVFMGDGSSRFLSVAHFKPGFVAVGGRVAGTFTLGGAAPIHALDPEGFSVPDLAFVGRLSFP